MYVPRLPTDNLYKFLALSGLVIAGLGAVLPYVARREAERNSIGVSANIQRLKLETERVDLLLRHLAMNAGMKVEGATIQEEELKQWAQAEITVPDDERAALFERALELLDQNLDLSLKLAELEADNRLLEQFEEEAKFASTVGCVTWPVGLVVAFAGFVLWYRKLQRHQDSIIRREARTN